MFATIGASYVLRARYAPAPVTLQFPPGAGRLDFSEFPIVEVSCEVGFPPIEGVDAMLIGKYWALHKERFGFPHREAGVRAGVGGGAFHTWLVSESGEFAIELESTRFAVRWRKRDNTYPHFSDLDGEEGVLTMSLRELDEYKRFCEAELPRRGGEAGRLAPSRLELVKIDHLVEGVNFADFAHFARAVPLVHGLSCFAAGTPARIDACSSASRDGADLAFRLRTLDGASPLTIAIETRVARPWSWSAASTSRDLATPFMQMNALANEVFYTAMGDPTAGGATP